MQKQHDEKWILAWDVAKEWSFGYRPWMDDNAPVVHELSVGRLRISFWKEHNDAKE